MSYFDLVLFITIFPVLFIDLVLFIIILLLLVYYEYKEGEIEFEKDFFTIVYSTIKLVPVLIIAMIILHFLVEYSIFFIGLFGVLFGRPELGLLIFLLIVMIIILVSIARIRRQ
jgi:hypothetical protein